MSTAALTLVVLLAGCTVTGNTVTITTTVVRTPSPERAPSTEMQAP